MSQLINKSRLFNASCFALITTALSFSIRAGILTELGKVFKLTPVELGYINSMAFLGFPIAMIVGGIMYNVIGPKVIMFLALITHILGIILTIYAGGFWGLLISTFFVGFGNGCTEAACNPMVADTYSGSDFSKMLNRFHMWFPGGIVIGSLISGFMTEAKTGWQLQMWVIMIPTIIYAILFYGQTFPKPRITDSTTADNFKAMLNPLYLFMLACMALTAISEFGPNQWVEPILKKAGASPMLILALVSGVMAVGRFFAGPIVHKLNTVGVLLGSAVFALIGILMMSQLEGSLLYVAAVVFAIGVCYFWPNMIGFVADNLPKTGALGLSIVGGMGMFSTAIFQPIIGGWIQSAKITSSNSLGFPIDGNLSEEAQKIAFEKIPKEIMDKIDLTAGQATLVNMAIFPAILIFAFIGLYFYMRKRTPAHA